MRTEYIPQAGFYMARVNVRDGSPVFHHAALAVHGAGGLFQHAHTVQRLHGRDEWRQQSAGRDCKYQLSVLTVLRGEASDHVGVR